MSHHAAQLELEYTWSQSYYYCIYAAIIYFVLASFMLVNLLGSYYGYYQQDITLSHTLRKMMTNTILYLITIFLGALVFSHIEDWQYLDSVYWADVTLLTIGFGDICPNTTLGRALLFPYTIFGIVWLGLTLTSIRELVLDRGKVVMKEKRIRKMRDELLKGQDKHGTYRSSRIPVEDC